MTTYVNDGRAFLERTDKKYDLILFALPDSLTLVSGASALRLESYLFTEEAIQSAREHLAPGGAFSMYNYYREQWLVDRQETRWPPHRPLTVPTVQPAGDFAGGVRGRRDASRPAVRDDLGSDRNAASRPPTTDRSSTSQKTPGSWASRRSIWP